MVYKEVIMAKKDETKSSKNSGFVPYPYLNSECNKSKSSSSKSSSSSNKKK